jgi:hypothetical protein
MRMCTHAHTQIQMKATVQTDIVSGTVIAVFFGSREAGGQTYCVYVQLTRQGRQMMKHTTVQVTHS